MFACVCVCVCYFDHLGCRNGEMKRNEIKDVKNHKNYHSAMQSIIDLFIELKGPMI